MPLPRVLFSNVISLALYGHGVNEYWEIELTDVPKHFKQSREVMTIHWPNVLKTHFLENRARFVRG